MVYTIGEMAKLLDVSASTLRYYDQNGLLPFVERTAGGIRRFTDKDYEWLRIILCLKKTGMPLKDIRSFVQMAMQGDETIRERLALIVKQREAVRLQMAELEKTLEILDFKCWYYETAAVAGTTQVPRQMPSEELPKRFQSVCRQLRREE